MIYYFFKHNNIEIYTDETNLLYVKKENKPLFIVSFEETSKPLVLYDKKTEMSSVLLGMTCDVMINETQDEYTATCFADSRDEYNAATGCLLSFKKLFPSLVKFLIGKLEITNEEANNIFYVVRTCLERYPIPVHKSRFYYA